MNLYIHIYIYRQAVLSKYEGNSNLDMDLGTAPCLKQAGTSMQGHHNQKHRIARFPCSWKIAVNRGK